MQRLLLELIHTKPLQHVLDVLNKDEEETRVVGGAVRNVLLGLPISDIDLATTALPQKTVSLARKAGFKTIPTGLEHGTVTILVEGHSFEVTTLREDIETYGRHATVKFGRDFKADALRRDFTMNALYLTKDAVLVDNVNGVSDVHTRKVRFIGDPSRRIQEDALRILRFFRFSAQYGRHPLDHEGLQACIQHRNLLFILSRERIRHETFKLLAAPRAHEMTSVIANAEVWPFISDIEPNLERFEKAVLFTTDPLLRLASLCLKDDRSIHSLRASLRLSNAECNRLSKILEVLNAIDDKNLIDDNLMLRLGVTAGLSSIKDALALIPHVQLSDKAKNFLDGWMSGTLEVPVFPIKGSDLINYGVKPGPEMGRLLQRLQEKWLKNRCVMERFDIEQMLKAQQKV